MRELFLCLTEKAKRPDLLDLFFKSNRDGFLARLLSCLEAMKKTTDQFHLSFFEVINE